MRSFHIFFTGLILVVSCQRPISTLTSTQPTVVPARLATSVELLKKQKIEVTFSGEVNNEGLKRIDDALAANPNYIERLSNIKKKSKSRLLLYFGSNSSAFHYPGSYFIFVDARYDAASPKWTTKDPANILRRQLLFVEQLIRLDNQQMMGMISAEDEFFWLTTSDDFSLAYNTLDAASKVGRYLNLADIKFSGKTQILRKLYKNASDRRTDLLYINMTEPGVPAYLNLLNGSIRNSAPLVTEIDP